MANEPGPGPNPFPCGGTNEPVCPPEPAADPKLNALAVVRWYEGLAPEYRTAICAIATADTVKS